jgi:hypothetical protein
MVKNSKAFDASKIEISDASTLDTSSWLNNSSLFDSVSSSYVKSEEGWTKKSGYAPRNKSPPS